MNNTKSSPTPILYPGGYWEASLGGLLPSARGVGVLGTVGHGGFVGPFLLPIDLERNSSDGVGEGESIMLPRSSP